MVPSTDETAARTNERKQQKRREWRLFLFIVVFLFPLLSVALVASYGFAVWIYQLLAGPPG